MRRICLRVGRLRPWMALRALVLAFTFSGAAQAGGVPACAGRAGATPPDFVDAVSRNAPALVHLLTVREWRGEGLMPDAENLFPMAASRPPVVAPQNEPMPALSERVTSSGFVLSPDGFILTSAHAVLDRREVWAVLADGRHLPARVVGVDQRADVALLKVAADGLPVVRPATEPVCAGQWVAALGAPFGFERTVTVGVVSAEPRVLQGHSGVALIQMNVMLNPGSSGGPLFNASGEVVGLNTMIFSSEGFYLGISFALPIGRALRVADRLRLGANRPRAAFVARTQPLSPALASAFGLAQAGGVLVSSDGAEAEAEAAGGLRRGDVVLAIDDQLIRSGDELEDAVAAHAPGAQARLLIWRQGRRLTLRVTLPAAPVEADAAQPADDNTPVAHRLGLRFVPEALTAQWPPGLYVENANGVGLLAGLEPGDRIVAVNATSVDTPDGFDAALAGTTADTVALLVKRGPMSLYVPVMRVLPGP
jgi:serine protease Do